MAFVFVDLNSLIGHFPLLYRLIILCAVKYTSHMIREDNIAYPELGWDSTSPKQLRKERNAD